MRVNIRGLNTGDKQLAVGRLIKENKLEVMIVVETRIKASKFAELRRFLNKQWKVINNYIMAPNGRIWICWNETKLKGT